MFINKKKYEELLRENTELKQFKRSVESNTALEESFLRDLDKTLQIVSSIYEDKVNEKDLEKYAGCVIEDKGNGYTCFRKMCHYGGCAFDSHDFKTKREALKDSAMIYLLEKMSKKIELKLNPNACKSIIHVNPKCKEYSKCCDVL